MKRLSSNVLLLAAALLLLSASLEGASWFSRQAPKPGKTTLGEPSVIIPAQIVSNYIIVSTKWDKRGAYNFLIDTGASMTLITPALAQRYGTPVRPLTPNGTTDVTVRSAEGDTTTLQQVSLRRLELGEASFENIPALVYDCSSLSVHLGIHIDGILGFPLFRETVLTLDYPHRRILLTRPSSAGALQPGTVVPFNNDQRTPIIPLQLQGSTFYALIDTGSDSSLRLNPVGFGLVYEQEPRPGAIVSTLTGDTQQKVARLAQNITIGDQVLEKPIIELTDELSAIGGAVLRNFILTFDQEHNRVTFYREQKTPVQSPTRRSSGFSVFKAGAYWRVVGVIPGSAAQKAGVEEGDLITRINEEPVELWGLERFNRLVSEQKSITFSFLVGKREYEIPLEVMDLVP
jgi:hypothetical protein